MVEYDVAVVGGGPIGSFIAEQLALKGRTVAVLEEHPAIGEPVHCAGLVTKRVFDITHCSTKGILQNKIYGAVIHSPNGQSLTIGGDKVHGLVIDRRLFDQHLATKAKDEGADFFLKHKVIQAKNQPNQIELTTQHETQSRTVRCRLLIGTDGAHSRIRTLFPFPKPKETLQGIGAELSNTMLDPQFVHIFLGEKIAPGFFAWIIPTNTHGTTARIGLCIKRHSAYPLQQYFTLLLKQPLLQQATMLKRYAGTIPLGALTKTTHDRIMLVGDAAAQVKPTSGGGLYTGFLCATHCIDIADAAFQTNTFDDRFLQIYHIRWNKQIGKELSRGMQFRKILLKLTDSQLNKYLQKLNNNKAITVINTYGDIDYPSQLAVPLLKTIPSLLSLAPLVIQRMKK